MLSSIRTFSLAPAQAFFSVISNGEILLSIALVNEIHHILYRSKFDRYINDAQREEFMLALVENGTLVDATEEITICRDPKDNMILELAVSGKADVIVTGDTDLLVLNSYKEIVILDPQTFLKQYST